MLSFCFTYVDHEKTETDGGFVLMCASFSADGREEGRPTAASSQKDFGQKLEEFGGAATEGAGALPPNAAAAVSRGHAHSAGLLPELSPLRE